MKGVVGKKILLVQWLRWIEIGLHRCGGRKLIMANMNGRDSGRWRHVCCSVLSTINVGLPNQIHSRLNPLLDSIHSTMGKLNIAHHKSYHPYRRDNIEKVKKDEEEARQKEAKEEGRMMLAVCSFVSLHSDILITISGL